MTRAELIAEYQRRLLDAERCGAAAPSLARVYETVLADLERLDGDGVAAQLVDCDQAARYLGCSPVTVARMAKRGELPGAKKTSGQHGRWRIPLRALDGAIGRTDEAPKVRRLV